MIFLSGWSFRDIQPSSPLPIAIARGSWFAVKMASDWFFVPLLFQTRVQSQRALLLQGTESLNNATQSIERSQRLAAEAEHVGTDIIDELGGQREQLDRARDRVSTLGFASRYVFFFFHASHASMLSRKTNNCQKLATSHCVHRHNVELRRVCVQIRCHESA